MRRNLLVAGLAAVAAIVGLFASRQHRDTSRERARGAALGPLAPGTAFVVDVSRDTADLDVEFQPNSRYIVVISSLARSTGSFAVTVSSEPIVSPEFPPRPLLPLRPGPAPKSPIARDDLGKSTDSASPALSQLPAGGRSGGDQTRTFALHVTDGSLDDPSQYAKVSAREVAHGRSVRVFLDSQQSTKELAPGLVETIADLFDNELIPRFRDVFGTYRDVDGDGRFSVLLSPWLARLQGGRTSIGGFVRGSDFQAELAPPFSNRCDMMYVISQTIPGPHLRTLLIHEYAHAVSFSQRTGGGPGQTLFPEEEDWLNEALAHCAESLFGGGWTNLDYRISRYLNDTAAYPLVVEDYYRAGLWRCHGCRGATYLFLRYCVERFGTQVLTRLISTPARGTRNLELATGCPFDRLFRDWTLWLLDRSISSGRGNPRDGVACGQLASLDLCGQLGPWGLAGPRPGLWEIDSGPLKLELKGTSAVFVEMSATHKPGLHRIHFAGTRGMQLQASLMRPQDDLPRIKVEATWSHRRLAAESPSAPVAAASGDDGVLRTTVRVAGGDNPAIEEIAAEQNLGEDRNPLCFCGESVKSIEVAAGRTSDTQIPFAQNVASVPLGCRVFELPTTSFTRARCPVVVKVVAVDRQGRRATGWATVREHAPQQVASVSAALH